LRIGRRILVGSVRICLTWARQSRRTGTQWPWVTGIAQTIVRPRNSASGGPKSEWKKSAGHNRPRQAPIG
jgi:hypothetical protein